MSTVERNKGKLIPVNIDTQSYTWQDWDDFDEKGFVLVDGRTYKVQWEVERETNCDYFAEVKTNPDGSIDFHTLHYNGGGHWTEVVESALEQEKN